MCGFSEVSHDRERERGKQFGFEIFPFLHVWETVSCKNSLSSNSTYCNHSQSSIQELRYTLLIKGSLVGRSKLGQTKVFSIATRENKGKVAIGQEARYNEGKTWRVREMLVQCMEKQYSIHPTLQHDKGVKDMCQCVCMWHVPPASRSPAFVAPMAGAVMMISKREM